MDITVDVLLGVATHGVLIVVILWQQKQLAEQRASLQDVNDKLFELLEQTDVIAAAVSP